MFDLTGHVAVVSGGNGGIGLGLARGVARCGGSVAIWGRSRTKNARAIEELRTLGSDAEAFPCDVASESDVTRACVDTLGRFGRIDSCFANAGMSAPVAFLDMAVDDWKATMDVNLIGVFLCFREAARHMVERGGGGKLIVTGSMGTHFGTPRNHAYGCSKAAVNALVKSLAVELGRHDIQVNSILPGWIETDMTAGAVRVEKLSDAVMRRTPARRWGQPDDLEGIAAYLASPHSRYHTGDTLRIDGGYTVF